MLSNRASNFCRALLLILHCLITLSSCQNSQATMTVTDLASAPGVGVTEVSGTKLRVFEVDGAQVAEPRISFPVKCSSTPLVRYNRLYLRYQLAVPIHLEANTLAKPLDPTKGVGLVTITDVELQLNAGLASDKSQVSTMMLRGKTEGTWRLTFLCDTFARCQDLRDELVSNPWTLQQAVRLILVGRVGNTTVKFAAIASANLPQLSDCSRGQWFVIQRNVDSNVSFAKNWDSYVKGFGNPNSNYWIGLESLFAMTAFKDADNAWKNPEVSLCQMRYEAVGLTGKKYWGQYGLFQVMGPDQNYRLRIGNELAGTNLRDFLNQAHERQFSTYDRDNDGRGDAPCSRLFGFGGWWYGVCHAVNPNAPLGFTATTAPYTYESANTEDGWVQVKQTVMMLKCD